ncbi:MAG: hypothetical protein P1U63_06780 [Coxiellaceae bacterium]|nr:hypothetical protein [Coxiellaceae bacterium]
MSITAIGKVSAFIISITASFLLLVPLSGYFTEAKKAATTTKTSLVKSSGGIKSDSRKWVCSPEEIFEHDNAACKMPDSFSVGIFLYVTQQAANNKDNLMKDYFNDKAKLIKSTWYLYLGGLCTLYYNAPPNSTSQSEEYNVQCINMQAMDPGSQSVIQQLNAYMDAQVWYPNTKYFVGVEFDDTAIGQIATGGQQSIVDAAATVNDFFYNASDKLNAAGLMLDLEGSDASKTNQILSASGAAFASNLSRLMPNSAMISIFAGKPGEISGGGYTWNLWEAVNRSTKFNSQTNAYECTESDPCQMGVFIYSLYDISIGSYNYEGGSTSFNLGIRDFPYQMKLMSNFAYQVANKNYLKPITYNQDYISENGAPSTLTAPFPNGAEINPPFGFYQLGITASGSANNSAAYTTLSSKVADTKIIQPGYWGSTSGTMKSMPYIKQTKCGATYSKTDCAFYYQNQMVPSVPSSAVKKSSKDVLFPIDITNQYLCTYLNAITYIYSNGQALPKPEYFCSMADRDAPEYLTTFSKVFNIYTFPPGFLQEGYNAMVGVALYQISDLQAGLLEKCLSQYPNYSTSSCYLIPVYGTIQTAKVFPTKGTWDMFIQWLEGNGGDITNTGYAPSSYIQKIPGFEQ